MHLTWFYVLRYLIDEILGALLITVLYDFNIRKYPTNIFNLVIEYLSIRWNIQIFEYSSQSLILMTTSLALLLTRERVRCSSSRLDSTGARRQPRWRPLPTDDGPRRRQGRRAAVRRRQRHRQDHRNRLRSVDEDVVLQRQHQRQWRRCEDCDGGSGR